MILMGWLPGSLGGGAFGLGVSLLDSCRTGDLLRETLAASWTCATTKDCLLAPPAVVERVPGSLGPSGFRKSGTLKLGKPLLSLVPGGVLAGGAVEEA